MPDTRREPRPFRAPVAVSGGTSRSMREHAEVLAMTRILREHGRADGAREAAARYQALGIGPAELEYRLRMGEAGRPAVRRDPAGGGTSRAIHVPARGATRAGRDLSPTSEDERALLQHVRMWGVQGYPIEKLRRGWIWRDWLGVRGSPIVYKTRRDVVAAFERWLDLMALRLGEEARRRHTERAR